MPVTIKVTGQSPSATLLSFDGNSMNAIVGYMGFTAVTAGESVRFIDISHNKLQLGTVELRTIVARWLETRSVAAAVLLDGCWFSPMADWLCCDHLQ